MLKPVKPPQNSTSSCAIFWGYASLKYTSRPPTQLTPFSASFGTVFLLVDLAAHALDPIERTFPPYSPPDPAQSYHH